MSDKKIQEGLADLAQRAEHDHEVQMARADLYKIAKYAIKLHDMLKNVSETEGLEGWQQAKITKASDYISSVYHNLDYDMKFNGDGDLGEGKSPHKKGTKAYKKQMAAEHASMSEDAYKQGLAVRLAEKAVSKSQQQAAGAALAAKRGDAPKSKLQGASKEMMKMSTKELEKFAGTKHKGLPKKKTDESELTEKTNAFQRGFNSVQKGNKFGPDAAERFVKGLFTGGGDDRKPDNDGTDTDAGKEKPAPEQPAAKAKPAVKGKPAPKQPAPKKEIPFPKSKEGVQLKPGDKVTYTNQRGKTQNAFVNKMLNTKDKHGDLQIQLKMGSVTFAIDRDNISAANGKPWTFDPATRRGTAKSLESIIFATTKDL